MLSRVDSFIRENKLLTPDSQLVVAVSGGPDSVCLLHIMHRLSASWGWALVVAHLEHGLRADASWGDAMFVQRLAAQLGWPVRIERRDVQAVLARAGGSVQDVCRQERHAFLQQVAQDCNAQAILVAHHAGDQAETVLLHLIRGAGLSGIAGMAASEPTRGDTAYVRPLLAASRADIIAYLRGQGIGFRVDASNATPNYARNRLRLEVMPLLASINPEVEAALSRTAALLQAEDHYLNQVAEAAWQQSQLAHDPPGLSVAQLTSYPVAIQRRVLRLLWQDLSGALQDLTSAHVESALTLLTQKVGSTASWPLDWLVRRSYDRLIWERGQAEPETGIFTLPIPGNLSLPQGQLEVRVMNASDFTGYASDPNIAYCDLTVLNVNELQVRYWRPGDHFYPLGLQGSKKLQDFFTDVKLDRRERERVPLIMREEEIVWVAGLRLDDRWKVKADSRYLLRLEYIQ